MKHFTWKDFLRHLPIFSSLSEGTIERLLEDETSQERECPQGSVILREGEIGDSIFLVGSGSVQVALLGKEGLELPVAILRSGEIFGEMSLFQQRPRSATVIARETSTLLEIKGEQFLGLVREYPDIEFKMILILSERVRQVNEQVLSVKLKDIDEKLNFFNVKLDAELKVVDASMRAAQAVFDQTKVRTDEVINSAERSRTRLTTAISAIVSVISIVMALFGFLGFKEIIDIRKEAANIEQQKEKIEKNAKTADALTGQIKNLSDQVVTTREKIVEHLLPLAFSTALKDQQDIGSAIAIYEDIRKLYPEDPKVILRLLKGEIMDEITRQKEKERKDYDELLWKMIDDHIKPEEKMTAYFLLLTNAILVNKTMFANGKSYDKALAEFGKYVKDNRRTKVDREVVEKLEKLFQELFPEGNPKRESFQGIIKNAVSPR